MTNKQIDVTCPCCSTSLTVDVLTGKILRSAGPQEVDETGKVVLDEGRWDKAKDRVHGRGESSSDAFDSALEREQNREDEMDSLFEKAKRKATGRPPEEPS